MVRLWVLLSVFLSFSLHATEVYFSPSSDCENRIVKAIDDSKTEITAAVYSVNNRKIAQALLAARKRGVKVRLLTDAVQAAGKSSLALSLLQDGLDVRLHTKFKIEHNKFGIYDGKWVSTGSFNWTGPAARSNSENCIFLNEAEVTAKFKERFEFLWRKNTADGSLAKVQKLKRKAR
jgi:phosphatidylserine/phosphatidylglycerophosphate/cardiolipin synthase-like enzyme